MQMPENIFMPEAPPKLPPEPGLGLFAIGVVAGALGAPLLLRWVSPVSSGPPGIADGVAAYSFYVLALLLAGGVAWACFALGRAVRRQRRQPRQRFVPRLTYMLVGLAAPAVFLLVTRCTDWGERIVGLHWALTIGGPFVLGLYTAPREAPGERPVPEDAPDPGLNPRGPSPDA